jgi:hypothetical protein
MEDFDRNLLRMIAAELLLLNGMTLAREMYGKSYFALGIGEKIAVDQTVLNMLSGNYQMITPEFLAGQEAKQPMGFGTGSPPTPQKTT